MPATTRATWRSRGRCARSSTGRGCAPRPPPAPLPPPSSPSPTGSGSRSSRAPRALARLGQVLSLAEQRREEVAAFVHPAQGLVGVEDEPRRIACRERRLELLPLERGRDGR